MLHLDVLRMMCCRLMQVSGRGQGKAQGAVRFALAQNSRDTLPCRSQLSTARKSQHWHTQRLVVRGFKEPHGDL